MACQHSSLLQPAAWLLDSEKAKGKVVGRASCLSCGVWLSWWEDEVLGSGCISRVTGHPLGWTDKFCFRCLGVLKAQHCATWQASAHPAHSFLVLTRKLRASPGPGINSPWAQTASHGHWEDKQDEGQASALPLRRDGIFVTLSPKVRMRTSHPCSLKHTWHPQGSYRGCQVRGLPWAVAGHLVGMCMAQEPYRKLSLFFFKTSAPMMCRHSLWCCLLANAVVCNHNLLFSA